MAEQQNDAPSLELIQRTTLTFIVWQGLHLIFIYLHFTCVHIRKREGERVEEEKVELNTRERKMQTKRWKRKEKEQDGDIKVERKIDG